MRLEEPECLACIKYWPKIRPWIEQALSHGGFIFTPEDILDGLLLGHMKLWLAFDESELKGCCIAQIEQYKRLKVCSVLAVGGKNSRDWLPYYESVRAWGKSKGCQIGQAVGRRGWEKKAAPLGFYPVATIYRMDL